MRKAYTKPFIVCEKFVVNESITACGDSGTIYKFKCNAGSSWNSYNVYLADGTPYATSGRDSGGCSTDYISYSPCFDADTGEGYHEANSNSVFLPGYMYKQDLFGENTGDRIDVVIWTDNYTDVHCTRNVDISNWETTRS